MQVKEFVRKTLYASSNFSTILFVFQKNFMEPKWMWFIITFDGNSNHILLSNDKISTFRIWKFLYEKKKQMRKSNHPKVFLQEIGKKNRKLHTASYTYINYNCTCWKDHHKLLKKKRKEKLNELCEKHTCTRGVDPQIYLSTSKVSLCWQVTN